MNKTIYVKDPVLWSRAQDLAMERGVSLSSIIEEGLRQFVEPNIDAATALQMFDEIVVLTEQIKDRLRRLS